MDKKLVVLFACIVAAAATMNCAKGCARGSSSHTHSTSQHSTHSSYSSRPSWSRWWSWYRTPSYSSYSAPAYRRWWSSNSYNNAPMRSMQTMCKGSGCAANVVSCPMGQVYQNGRCVGCPQGQQMQGNRCVDVYTQMRDNRAVRRRENMQRTVQRRVQQTRPQGPEPVRTSCSDSQIRQEFMANYNNWKGGQLRTCSELVRNHPEFCERSQAIREDCCLSCGNRGRGMNLNTLRRHHEMAAQRAYQRGYRMSKGK